MAATIRNRPIATWKSGDAVQGYALVRRRELRQDKGGRDYLDLELADASGSIPAKAWSDSKALAHEFAAHDFVKFSGQVQSYREQLQLKLDNCRAATAADREDGFDEGLLVPSTKEDLDALWSRLEGLLDAHLARPELRRLAAETLAVHGAALRVHPAAKAIHHAFRGGLLEHVVSMLELATRVCDHYLELDRDLVLLGVLFHDLGKIDELGAMPANDYTPVGRLVGHIVLGRDLLRDRIAALPDFPAELALQLEHVVLSHQGRKEFGSPVEPMTAGGDRAALRRRPRFEARGAARSEGRGPRHPRLRLGAEPRPFHLARGGPRRRARRRSSRRAVPRRARYGRRIRARARPHRAEDDLVAKRQAVAGASAPRGSGPVDRGRASSRRPRRSPRRRARSAASSARSACGGRSGRRGRGRA